ncbi:MAG: hypothetical protein LBP63_10830 [Prevotellaceae bacterium]|jgi:hypothetical protein|nr:hypothetical protein [Prevotellaceae bacterium]
MITVVDFLSDTVTKTSNLVKKVIEDETIKQTGVFYQYGHLSEIKNVLSILSQTTQQREKKYPAILLLQDFLERKGYQQDIETEVNLQLLIVTGSKPDYRASERYFKIFKPILYPIYECLMKVLKKDGRLANGYGDIAHNKIDRPNISGFKIIVEGQTQQLFYDCLDAIEINNLNLKIKKTC